MTEDKTKNTETVFNVSDSAAKRIAYLMSDEDEGTKLRISVNGGGCSGFQYKYDLVKDQDDDDLVIEKEGAVILLDALTVGFVKGSTLDYVETLGSAAFEIKNPNSTANCGCGNSFSV